LSQVPVSRPTPLDTVRQQFARTALAPLPPEWQRVREFLSAWERIRPLSTGRTYINFQTADEDEERVRATYGANFDRLVEVKEKFDPDNVFRSNRNIRPRIRAGKR
jgi:hypothetical protein